MTVHDHDQPGEDDGPSEPDTAPETQVVPVDPARPPLWRRVRDSRGMAVANERARGAARRAREVTVAVAKDERTADAVKAGLAIGVAALVAHRQGDRTPWTTAFAAQTDDAGTTTPPRAPSPPSRPSPTADGRRPWHELYAEPPRATPPTTGTAPTAPLSVFAPVASPPVPESPRASGPSASRVSEALRQAHQDQMAVIRNLRA